jgi:hypothetical protein
MANKKVSHLGELPKPAFQINNLFKMFLPIFVEQSSTLHTKNSVLGHPHINIKFDQEYNKAIQINPASKARS